MAYAGLLKIAQTIDAQLTEKLLFGRQIGLIDLTTDDLTTGCHFGSELLREREKCCRSYYSHYLANAASVLGTSKDHGAHNVLSSFNHS